ncbi:MAG: GNAT family N-acetyltransferase [Chloroflexi bacterium]|nr:GNAT family N-acetyltransferase [Chloroflexota bacterium]
MRIEPRPYQDSSDLDRMLSILIEGRKADNGTYYVHTGDLSWWLFYHDPEEPLWEQIALWEDDDGQTLGWALFTPNDGFFDLFVHPSLTGTQRARQMHAWAEEQIAEKVKARGGKTIRVMWVFETDAARRQLLEERGFSLAGPDSHLGQMIYFTRSLAEPVARPTLPDGFVVRSTAGEREVEARAAAQYGAFQSKWQWDRYVARFRRFMQSPVYDPERDVAAVAPEGRFAAFCIFWLDPVNKVSLFEPVGTHPDFQKRGLGKAVLLEGLRRMKANVMETAIVCAEADNQAAVRLYESVGFRVANKLCMYVKDV